ncbi:MAG: D-ribose ABC transporter substrate-binding protein [Clostridium sp.]
MRIRKKILMIAMIGILAIGALTGCTKENNPKKVGLVLSTLNNPFFVSIKEGAEKEATKRGFDLIVLDSVNDPAKERANVEDLIELGVSAVLINPTDSDAVINTVKVCNEKNIPVITIDRSSNGGEVTSHIASDNIKGGEMAGRYALDEFKGAKEINVVELQGIPGASATRDRGQGFHNILDSDKRVKFVSIQAADFDRQKGLQVMENIIQGNDNIDVIFAHNDEMALGATKAMKGAKNNAMIIGFDGNDDAKDSIDSNEMKATVAQQPELLGALGVELTEDIYNGKSVDKETAADLKIYIK